MSLEHLRNLIKDKPVSEIIALYLPLTRKGAQTLAVCPFHDDHAPSMNINDSKGMFFCFVDQIGGDSIKFVELFLSVNFKEALQDIAEKLGLNFESYLDKNENPKFKAAHYLLEKTTQVYAKMAWEDSCTTFKNFLKNRKLSDEIAKTYRLGFAPKNSVLGKYFSTIKDKDKKKDALALAEELALLRNNKGQSGTYDYFRERIIFPVWDHYGNVIGYTSRATSDSQKAKYLNSMESLVFKKRDLLYGLHLAKQDIRATKSVIVVEGNMDQIALYKEGFKNSVAIMGTAMGNYAVTTLSQMADTIYLALDNDQAGINAANRINAQFMEIGILPKMIDLAPSKDPDDFLEQFGALELQKRIEQANVFLDQQINSLIPVKSPEVTDKKLSLLKAIYPILSPLSKEIEIKARLGSISKQLDLNLDLQTIFDDFKLSKKENEIKTKPFPANKTSRQKKHQVDKIDTPAPPFYNSNQADFTNNNDDPHSPLPQKLASNKIENTEKVFITEIILYPELITHCDVKELLDFVTSDEVNNFVLSFSDFLLEIDEQVYSKTLLAWVNEQNLSTQLSALIGASIYQYRNTRPNEKVLLKMRDDLKYRLKEEFLKSKRVDYLTQKVSCQTKDELSIYLQVLSNIDKEISTHKKNKKKNIN